MITENSSSKMDTPTNISLVGSVESVTESIEYKTVSVFLVLLVCGVGIVGNIMVVLVVLTTRHMRTPTNCYLVSLAVADLTVLVAAGLPNISDSLVGAWIYGHAGCLGITYFQYLGINVSSCSITAFTVERYIAICHPMRAQTVCTVSRAKRIIAGVWVFPCVYCMLWFFLVDIQVNRDNRVQCGYRVSRDLYLPIYLIDFAIFYVFPLLLAIVLYGLIARILFMSPMPHRADTAATAAVRGTCKESADLCFVACVCLVLLSPTPYLDAWFLLFCRICIYANSAINPVVYNLMSQKFRAAFRGLYRCQEQEVQRRTLSTINTSTSVVRDMLDPSLAANGKNKQQCSGVKAEKENRGVSSKGDAQEKEIKVTPQSIKVSGEETMDQSVV
uniref:Thyrotropin-releasing hormone receptor n=1 Tax=Scleropages formosus TaxID=113540 RepID=A0A8C9V8K3_SCLFO